MLRRVPLKPGKGFKAKPRRHEPAVEREPKPLAKATRRAVYGGTTSGPVSKPQAQRNPALLEMARGRPCLLLVPGIGTHPPETVVAAHSNLLRHGKSKSRKADDQHTVAACYFCHCWLDQGPASAEEKEAAFLAGHERQVDAWRNIAAAGDEPERFRNAARWALERVETKE